MLVEDTKGPIGSRTAILQNHAPFRAICTDKTATKPNPLRGQLGGYWSLTVKENWRISFRFERGDAHDLELIDYH